jgi:hypothetical protein
MSTIVIPIPAHTPWTMMIPNSELNTKVPETNKMLRTRLNPQSHMLRRPNRWR